MHNPLHFWTTHEPTLRCNAARPEHGDLPLTEDGGSPNSARVHHGYQGVRGVGSL